MTHASNASGASKPWSGWPMWPFGLLEPRTPAAAIGFDQPINPGWTFGNLISVTEQNSSSPDTERNIVAAHSYGRQLGRLMDAVVELIAELPESTQQQPAFKQLATLRDSIDAIKTKAAARRLDRVAADLVELKKSDMAEYRRVVAELRGALEDVTDA